MFVLIFVCMLGRVVLMAMHVSIVLMVVVIVIVIRMVVFVRMLDAISMHVDMLVSRVVLFVVSGVHNGPLT